MSKKCILCGSTDVVQYGKNLLGEPMLMCNNCKESGVWYNFEEPTLFDRITESPEVLAEKLVYAVSYHWEMEFRYTSNLIPGHKRFNTEAEAIAATLAKLKEVAE